MSEFIGSTISLISKSDIRYVGTLHEINGDESTVSLENVKSFGTEGRKAEQGIPEQEVAPSEQLYEFIIFRGSDVKDLRIEQGPPPPKEIKPPPMPNDPAILGARTRGGPPVPGPSRQQPPPPGPNFGYYPQHPGAAWGRGGGPAPGPGPAPFAGFPPPPGWFAPGQGFPPPGGPASWGPYPYPQGPPGAPLGPLGLGGVPPRGGPITPGQEAKPVDALSGAPEKHGKRPANQLKNESAAKPASAGGQAPFPPTATNVPTPPVNSKPPAAEVHAVATSLAAPQGPASAAAAAPESNNKPIPTGPKGSRPMQIMPVVPLPTTLTTKVAQSAPPMAPADSKDTSSAALRDATQAAKAAVAVAMAKLETSAGTAPAPPNVMDNLTKKVNEMRITAARNGHTTRGGSRGRGGYRPVRVEVPNTDFDFELANAKFNKQDIVKEVSSTNSPLQSPTNGASGDDTASKTPEPAAYDKSKSFFDNISSEARDRAKNGGQKPGGREWRGEEQRKNMETFGQGSVDGGYRSSYRGRGRGRGGRGRGYGRGGHRNGETRQMV